MAGGMLSAWRNLLPAASMLFFAVGCGESEQLPAPEPAPAAVTPRDGAIYAVPGDNADGYLVKVEGGKWCIVPASETFVSGNARLCTSILMSSITVDPAAGPPHRRYKMKSTYHQPGPITDDGDMVHWNEADVRYNCETHELWIVSIVTYGKNDAVIESEQPDPPRKAPGANPDLGHIVCTPPLAD